MTSKINPAQLQKRLGTASDPGSVHGLAHTGTQVLAAHYGADGRGALHRLDPKTLAPVGAPLPVGHQPRAVEWHPRRKAAYVMNRGKDSYSVSKCDLATGTVTDIKIGFGIIAIAVDPVADLLYVADWAHHRLIVIQLADTYQRHFVALPSAPVQVEVGPDGDVLVPLSLQSVEPPVDALAIVKPDGTVQTAPMIPSHLQPGPIDVGSDGTVYLGSLGGGGVVPLVGAHDPESGERIGSTRSAAGVRALGAHPHLQRAWAATDAGVQVVDLSNPYAPVALDPVTTGSSPYGIVVGQDGAVYVGDDRDGTVTRLEPDLTEIPLEAVSTLLTEAGFTAPTIAKSLAAYQTFHGLPVTSRPDATTVGHLTAPGCGTPMQAAHQGFRLNGMHLRHTDITYFLGNMHMPAAPEEFTDAIKEEVLLAAFKDWADILNEGWYPPCTFTRVDDQTQADIVFSVGDDPIFHDTGWFRTVYAVTNYKDKVDGEHPQMPVIFNRKIFWDAPGYWDRLITDPVGTDFRHVALHEIGHALGLDHSGESYSVMYRKATWYRLPKADDQFGFRALYGKVPFVGGRGMEVLPGVDHVSYQDCERHLMVHFRSGDGWTATRLDSDVNAPRPMRGFGLAHAFMAHDGIPSYVYQGADRHVHQLWFDADAWWWNDLTAESGGAPPAKTSVRGYRNGEIQRVAYGATDGRVIRMSQAPGTGWVWEDVSQPGAGVPKDSSIVGYIDENTGYDVLAYRDDGDGLRLLQEGPDGWSHLSLSWATQDENPDLIEAVEFSAFAPKGEPHRLFAVDYRLALRMFVLGDDGVWHTRSLSAELGLPETGSATVERLPGASGSTWSIVVSAYSDGTLRELTSPTGDTWTAHPVAPDDLPRVGQSVRGWISGSDRHLAYIGSNGNLRLLTRPLSAPPTDPWDLTNLTRQSDIL